MILYINKFIVKQALRTQSNQKFKPDVKHKDLKKNQIHQRQ